MKKVILITGASSGMGFATLQKLVSEGYTIYGTGRTGQDMRKIKKAGAHALIVEMTDYKTLESAVSRVIREQGKIDVLFNNAGYGLYGTVEETSIKDAKNQFEVNLFGLARITQLVLPYMRRARSGMIINMSSMGGKVYTPLGAWYHASKHALEGWSDCLRLEVAEFGIKVVIIEPGGIQTAWGIKAADNAERISGGGPYGRFASRTAEIMRKNYNSKRMLSPPSVIAELVLKVIRSKHPKRRYVAGRFGMISILIRKYFGDAIYERIIMAAMQFN